MWHVANGRSERTVPVFYGARRMRVTLLTALVCALLAWPAAVPANAQNVWSIDARIGSSFANIGNTFVISGGARFPVTPHISVLGEIGALPRAPFQDASELAVPLPPVAPGQDLRVNGYHLNANVQVNPIFHGNWAPYVTAGLGSFTADTVATGTVGDANVRASQRETNFATNWGVGLDYRLTEWLNVNGEYRTFYVHRDDTTPRVSRFTAGIGFLLR